MGIFFFFLPLKSLHIIILRLVTAVVSVHPSALLLQASAQWCVWLPPSVNSSYAFNHTYFALDYYVTAGALSLSPVCAG